MKKSLKGFIKTPHFQERQLERQVSDREVIEAITRGELVTNDDGQNYYYDDIKVTVDHALEILITVHPKDPKTKQTKLLKKEDALRIKKLLTGEREPERQEDEFQKFVREHKVRKIK